MNKEYREACLKTTDYVAHYRKEMIARCHEYAKGMAEIGADQHREPTT